VPSESLLHPKKGYASGVEGFERQQEAKRRRGKRSEVARGQRRKEREVERAREEKERTILTKTPKRRHA